MQTLLFVVIGFTCLNRFTLICIMNSSLTKFSDACALCNDFMWFYQVCVPWYSSLKELLAISDPVAFNPVFYASGDCRYMIRSWKETVFVSQSCGFIDETKGGLVCLVRCIWYGWLHCARVLCLNKKYFTHSILPHARSVRSIQITSR